MGLFNWHVHDWEEMGRVKLPDTEDAIGFKRYGGVFELRQDRTSIHLRCRICHDVKSEMLMGWLPAAPTPEPATPSSICGEAYDIPNGTDVMTAICALPTNHPGPHNYVHRGDRG